MEILKKVSQEYLKSEVTEFSVGDTRNGSGIAETFTVRRVAFGEGVERVFRIHSPRIDKIEVTRRGKVRRAKLYYLRDKVGKAARVKELRDVR